MTKYKILIPAVLGATLLLNFILASSCANPVPDHPTQPKAAIIDQLGSVYPNEQFIQEITENLEKSGFTVTLVKGDQITVNLYQKLPTYGFKLIIFRVHSTMLPGKEPLTDRTFLFTSEPYSKSKYVSYQLTDRVLPARVDENSPYYFSVSSDFMAGFIQGQFNQSVIIMMGCASLRSTDMAEAFINRGALIYTGWTASVKLDFVDDFTIALIRSLCVKGTSFKEALYQTADEKGIYPTYRAVFSYYPRENENYSLSSTK